MKIIIIGAGKVGKSLAERLASESHSVTVVDINKTVVEDIVNTCDVMGICGNGALYGVEEEAGAKTITRVFTNLSPLDIRESVNAYAKAIEQSQISSSPVRTRTRSIC